MSVKSVKCTSCGELTIGWTLRYSEFCYHHWKLFHGIPRYIPVEQFQRYWNACEVKKGKKKRRKVKSEC